MADVRDASKSTFVRTWGQGGYRENWAVYGKMSGAKESDVVARCLAPFYDRNSVCLEIGCGAGFWTDQYLAKHFQQVIALDVIPRPQLASPNIRYIEVPDRNFDCFGVADASIDFAWSFGVFCHMTLPSIQHYLHGIFRVCRPNARCSLYFSNIERRPGTATVANTEETVPWIENDLARTIYMIEAAGFVDVTDLMPTLPDTMVSCRRP